LMIEPPPTFRIDRQACLVPRNLLIRLSARVASKDRFVVHQAGRIAPVPALLTRIST
jgi:hypothetical protein